MVDFFSRLLKKLYGGGFSASHAAETATSGSGERKATLAHAADPRRYRRAILLTGKQDSSHFQLAAATVFFRSKPFSVYDISHTGLAILRENMKDHEIPDSSVSEKISVQLGRYPSFDANAKVVRHSEKILAFEFEKISAQGRLAVDQFLDPKMVGLNMRVVDRSIYSSDETFSLWLCGPRDTNFFIWQKQSDQIDRALLQMGRESIELAARDDLSAEVVSCTGKRADLIYFALDVALQVQNGGPLIRGLVKLLTDAADTGGSDSGTQSESIS